MFLPYSPALPSAIGIFAQDPAAIRQDVLQIAADRERMRDQLQQHAQNQQ